MIVSKWRLATKVSHGAATAEPPASCEVVEINALGAGESWTPSDWIKEDLGVKGGSMTLGNRVLMKRS